MRALPLMPACSPRRPWQVSDPHISFPAHPEALDGLLAHPEELLIRAGDLIAAAAAGPPGGGR